MATTTNYGWETPDDTDLVKDGAAAIRTLGSAIDTTTKALNPETTLGDISYRSSTADTNTRLAIGTSGQVLSVSGGVPAWTTPSSGGMTLISTTTLSSTSVTLSSIPQTYNNLYLYFKNVVNTTSSGQFYIRPNNVTNTGTYVINNKGTTNEKIGGEIETPNALNVSNNDNGFSLLIQNYAEAAVWKPMTFQGRFVNSSSQSNPFTNGGAIYTANAITSIVLLFASSQTFTGGTVLLYGVK